MIKALICSQKGLKSYDNDLIILNLIEEYEISDLIDLGILGNYFYLSKKFVKIEHRYIFLINCKGSCSCY